MKYYVRYYTWNRAGTKKSGWGIVEFNFRRDITKSSIKDQLVPEYDENFKVTQMTKL